MESNKRAKYFFEDEDLLSMEQDEAQRFLKMQPFSKLNDLAKNANTQEFMLKTARMRPIYFKHPFNLYDYQEDALRWMRERENAFGSIKGGIMSMKMGLGKTLTALAHILSSPKGNFPTLVIASKTVLNEWQTQGCEKFFENAPKTLFFHKDFMNETDITAMTREKLIEFDIVFTSYDFLNVVYNNVTFVDKLMDKKPAVIINLQTRKLADNAQLSGSSILYGTPWCRIICDESQRFANPKTVIFRSVMALYGDYKWCLSGTPIRNYKTDIWAQLRFCGYTTIDKASNWNKEGNFRWSSERLSKYVYTMDYDEAHITLPKLHEHIHEVQMSPTQQLVYNLVLKRTKEIFEMTVSGTSTFMTVINMFTRLRQCVIAPYLMTSESKRNFDCSYSELSPILEDSIIKEICYDKTSEAGYLSAKIQKTIEILRSIPSGEKVVFFTMFTSYLDLMKEAIKEFLPGFYFLSIDGDTKGNERGDILEKFKTDPSVRVLLLTYKVGGEGLNIVEANHCICGEPWWNDAVHSQAIARVWRTGQKKEVHHHQVIVANSIEKYVLGVCQQKNSMTAEFFGKGSNNQISMSSMASILYSKN